MICRDDNICLAKFVERTLTIRTVVLDTIKCALCVFIDVPVQVSTC